ncbi:MAG: hypothetical protein RJA70_293 [Pseudomonadota bacterium]|jgi:uroporphyrinogen-III synthase
MSSELAGVRVITFESRRSEDMQRLIEKRGGTAVCAPTMREVPLSDPDAAIQFAKQAVRCEYDALVMLSGGGTRQLIEFALREIPRDEFLGALRRMALICRGPKPVQVLREHGLAPTLVAPEPNTSDDLLKVIFEEHPLASKRVAVQEYGEANTEFHAALREHGAEVTPILVYRWTLPDDTGPLQNAIRLACAGEAEAALFTSARQVVHVLQVAEDLGLRAEVVQALNSMVVVSVGPVTSRALIDAGLTRYSEPAHPKMGHLVQHLAKSWVELQAR